MAWIPPAFLNSVVALGVPSQGQETQYTGTGFMYGYPTGATDENGMVTYWPFLVTNRHVFTKARTAGRHFMHDSTSPQMLPLPSSHYH